MEIKSISVRNLRLFGDEEQQMIFCPDKKVSIILGNNGAGKTSLLHGMTILLSQYFEPFPSIGTRSFTDGDIHVVSDTSRADYMKVGMELQVSNGQEITIEQYRRGNTASPTTSNIQAIKEYALTLKTAIDNQEQVILPIFAYYGTERGQISAPERRRDFNTVFPRWAAYEDALEPATNFKRFFTWFERNEDIERRIKLEQLEQHKTEGLYSSPVLDAVREAISKMDLHLVRPRVLVSPLRFVMDDVSDEKHPKEVRIEMMSDGYRIMIAMIADIAARMAEANPDEASSGMKNPLETPGVVFIDEIDLHLHPKWQRIVLRQLTSIFPNVQFIVTTHSPNVVLGSLDFAQVIKLEHGQVVNDINLNQYVNYDVSLLLLSDLFELNNVRSDEFKKLDDEIQTLLAQPNLGEEETKRLKKLMQQMQLYYPYK